MSVVLGLAGCYNLVWAGWAIGFPAESFAASGMERPDQPLHYPHLWQGIGMLVGVFGVGYLLAATDPVHHRGIVLVGFISKVLGGLGAVSAVITGQSQPVALLWTGVNDLVWWVPFALIFHRTASDRETQ